MAKFECIKKCYWGSRLWTPGEICERDAAPNEHFNQVGEYVQEPAKKFEEPKAETAEEAKEESKPVTKKKAKPKNK